MSGKRINHIKIDLFFSFKTMRFSFSMSEYNALNAISPLDGRYAGKTPVAQYFSEGAYIKERLRVSYLWFKYVLQSFIPNNGIDFGKMDTEFKVVFNDEKTLLQIKNNEKKTNHDVQAIIDFLKSFYLDGKYGDPALVGYVHYCLTSQDLNTSGIKIPLRSLIRHELSDSINQIRTSLRKIIVSLPENTAMMGSTHGQPAVIVTMKNVLTMFHNQIGDQLSDIVTRGEGLRTKFGGATGGFNSLKMIMKLRDPTTTDATITKFADDFCRGHLEMERNGESGQTDSYIDIANLVGSINVLNLILVKVCSDIWSYNEKGYIKIKPKDGETGSSAMPHKVNPIDFENAESNLLLANSISHEISNIILTLKRQRDLRDSTALRNLGSFVAYCMLAYSGIVRGLDKISINVESLNTDIISHPEIYSESIQTILRTYGCENGYDMLKQITRGKIITADDLMQFADTVVIDTEFIQKYHPSVSVEDIRQYIRNAVKDHSDFYAPVEYALT